MYEKSKSNLRIIRIKNALIVAILAVYVFLMYQVWELCQYGGLSSHLMKIVPALCIFIVGLIVWIFLRFKSSKKNEKISLNPYFFVLMVIGFLSVTIFFAGKIIYSAIPYNGALSWKLDEFFHKKKISFAHKNIYKDGMNGVFTDLNKELDMPEQLYVSNDFTIQFGKDGNITKMDTFLYGDNEKGEKKTYLINYDASKDDTSMHVWVDGEVNSDYDEERLLNPMFKVLEQVDIKGQVEKWSGNLEAKVYEILYYGKRSFNHQEGLVFVSGDENGDGIIEEFSDSNRLSNGGVISGYEVSLYVPSQREITPVRYIMEPEYISQEILTEQRINEQEKEAKKAKGWIVDKDDGTVYFFLEDNNLIGWKLEVVDAALGSRFYNLKYTEDGGNSWTIKNEDPFLGKGGVAEGIEFFDQSYGCISIGGASGDYSTILVTRDGGIHFKEINLPMETVNELPENGKQYGFSVDDYNYLSMPNYDNERLTIKVKTNVVEEEGIIFESYDKGESWRVVD